LDFSLIFGKSSFYDLFLEGTTALPDIVPGSDVASQVGFWLMAADAGANCCFFGVLLFDLEP